MIRETDELQMVELLNTLRQSDIASGRVYRSVKEIQVVLRDLKVKYYAFLFSPLASRYFEVTDGGYVWGSEPVYVGWLRVRYDEFREYAKSCQKKRTAMLREYRFKGAQSKEADGCKEVQAQMMSQTVILNGVEITVSADKVVTFKIL